MEKNKEEKSTEDTSTIQNKFRPDYYTKMKNHEFEFFCKRFFTFHSTGIYTPPGFKDRVCNKKKKVVRGPQKYIADAKNCVSTFGQGKVGSSCKSYGVKNCLRCRPKNEQNMPFLDNVDPLELNISIIYDQIDEIDSKIRSYANFLDSDSDIERPSTSTQRRPIVIDKITISDSDTENEANPNETNTLFFELNPIKKEVTSPVNVNNSDVILDTSDNMPKSVEKNTGNGKIPKDKTSLDCPICLESINNAEIMSTICGHIFCAFCIIRCIRENKQCPTCRQKLTLKSIHPIFI